MDTKLATAILNVCKEGGYFDGDLPSDEGALLEKGEYFLNEARKCYDDVGMRNDTIMTVLKLAGDDVQNPGEPSPTDPGPVELPPRGDPDEKPEPDLPPGPSPAEEAKKEGFFPKGENLPVPPEIEGDATPMPKDITLLSDRGVRRLSGEYSAFLGRVTWLVACESSALKNAEALKISEYRKALRQAKSDADLQGEKITGAMADAKAGLAPTVVEWDTKLKEHESALEKLKALREIYKNNVDRLSREASMRNDEWQRSGGRGS